MSQNPLLVHIAAYYPPHLGGLEGVAKTLAEKLAERGSDVHVFTSRYGQKSEQPAKKPNLTVHNLWGFEFAHTPFTPTLLWHLLTLPKNSIMHVHLSQAYYPELVMVASKIRSIPYVTHFHLDVEPSGRLGALFMVYKKIVWGPFLRSSRKVITFSEEQSILLQTKYNVSQKNIAVIPNGVGGEFFNDVQREGVHAPARLLYVGRLTVQKRVDRLIEALALVSVPVELTIVGDGEDRKKLEDLARQLKLDNIYFVGRKSGEDLMAYYRNSDVFLLSSDREGMPLVVLEAMAAGLPIVGSDVIGIRELVGNVGMLVSNPSAENFAAAITELINKPERIKELSLKSIAKARTYSWDRLVVTFEEIYKEMQR